MPIVIADENKYMHNALDAVLSFNYSELKNILESAIEDQINDMTNEYKDPRAPRKLAIEFTFQRSGAQNSGLITVDWKITPKPAPFDRTPDEGQVEGQMSMKDITDDE